MCSEMELGYAHFSVSLLAVLFLLLIILHRFFEGFNFYFFFFFLIFLFLILEILTHTKWGRHGNVVGNGTICAVRDGALKGRAGESNVVEVDRGLGDPCACAKHEPVERSRGRGNGVCNLNI
jgi:hypothetical protein